MTEKKTRVDWGGEKVGDKYLSQIWDKKIYGLKRQENKLDHLEDDHTVPLFTARNSCYQDIDIQAENNLLIGNITQAMKIPGFFTKKELQYLHLYSRGLNNAEIGRILGCTRQNANHLFNNVVN